MARRGVPETLPLPRSWLLRSEWTGEARTEREIALSAAFPRPGTKAHIRALLQAAGWDDDALDQKALDQTRNRLFDLPTEMSGRAGLNIDRMATDLRKKGLAVTPTIHQDAKTPTTWVKEVWDSVTREPWWVSTASGRQSMVLVSHMSDRVEQGSALFITDTWAGLGAAPEHRLPVFRRVSLVALMHPETLTRFMETTGKSTDLLVVHGGFLEKDSAYQTFANLAAVQSMFHGFVLYEAVVPQSGNPAWLGDVARRSGFPLVIGVS